MNQADRSDLNQNAIEAKEDTIAFMVALARSLHAYGAPGHQVEDVLSVLSAKLGLKGQFFALPTAIFASFGDMPRERSIMTRLNPGSLDLERLRLLDRVMNQVFFGEIDVKAGLERLARIDEKKPRYGAVLTTLAYGFASGCATGFFGGGIPEMLTALGIGLMIGLLALVAKKWESFSRIFEITSAFGATFIAFAVAAFVYPISVHAATLSGLIVLIPGLTLTISMRELAAGHLACGTARFSGALLAFVAMGLGVALGTAMGELLPLADAGAATSAVLPVWAEWAMLVMVAICFAVLFKAMPKDIIWMIAAGILAFWGSRGGAHLLGPQLGAFVGAALVCIASNLFARITNAPSSIPMVPGIIILVPGALGFRSISALLENDVLAGVQTAFTAVMVGISLVAGMLLSNAVLPSRKIM